MGLFGGNTTVKQTSLQNIGIEVNPYTEINFDMEAVQAGLETIAYAEMLGTQQDSREQARATTLDYMQGQGELMQSAQSFIKGKETAVILAFIAIGTYIFFK